MAKNTRTGVLSALACVFIWSIGTLMNTMNTLLYNENLSRNDVITLLDREGEELVEDRLHGHQPQEKKFITYKILRNLPLNCGYGDIKMFSYYEKACLEPDRAKLQAGAQPGVLDFNTQIRTNLNILYVGSSVAHQFAQAFEEASTPVERQVTRYASNKRGWYQENVVSSLTPYNGTISCLRITGLFLKNRMEKVRFLAPYGGGGWLSSDVRQLKQLAHQWRNVNSTSTALGNIPTACERDHGADDKNNAVPVQLNGTIDNQQECEEKNFDVVVYQPPVEWVHNMQVDEALSWEAIHEAVELSFDRLGASTIILQTIPIQNNVNDINELVVANRRIWKYAMEFQTNLTTKSALESTSKTNKNEKTAQALQHRRKILVMDLYSLSVASYLQNSIEIGIAGNDTGKDLKSKLFPLKSTENPFHFLNLTFALSDSMNIKIPHRKKFNRGKITKLPGGEVLYMKIGHLCGDANCTIKSSITLDGQHWCMEQFAGRLNAGLACLTQCSLALNNNSGEFLGTIGETMSDCERSCNAQFMSLDPVRWENGQETIVNGTAFVGLDNYRKQL